MFRLKLPSTLAVTLLCSCHSGGHPVTDAPLDGKVIPITDARPADALASDAPIVDAGVDAVAAVDAAPADAAVDAIAQVDATITIDAPPDAAVAIDAIPMPDADLG
jgi:hypothetical protein